MLTRTPRTPQKADALQFLPPREAGQESFNSSCPLLAYGKEEWQTGHGSDGQLPLGTEGLTTDSTGDDPCKLPRTHACIFSHTPSGEHQVERPHGSCVLHPLQSDLTDQHIIPPLSAKAHPWQALPSPLPLPWRGNRPL